jgi:UDP-N-acetylglucosamine:LPS N-acetylglucosamine transferase
VTAPNRPVVAREAPGSPEPPPRSRSADRSRRVWLVLPDLLSIRMFFDSGIVEGLNGRLDGRLAVVFLVPREEASEWTDRVGDAPVHLGEHLTSSRGSFLERAAARIDRALDGRLGYHPLAIRLNYRHGFHLDRMAPGHPNWMLDTDRAGPLPRWRLLERVMQRWHFWRRRHVPRRLLDAMEKSCSALVVSNVQPRNAVPFLVAARRLALPVVGHVASWDHTVGKGVISPHCDVYVVQNRVMEDDLRRYHGIAPDRVVVTGWPQTDVFLRRRPRERYEELLRGYGLDPERPLVLVMGNTPTNAPYEGRFVERLVAWWEENARDRFQLLVRPHPRDKEWRERFGGAARDGVHVQEASYRDLEDLAALLQHGDVVVCNAGTILVDALVNDRPAVCVLYDEGAPPGESWAAKNVIGEHYRQLAASGAFHTAETFEEVVAGIERSLADPGELAEARRRAVRDVVGEVDGHAAERVVDAVVRVAGTRATVPA